MLDDNVAGIKRTMHKVIASKYSNDIRRWE
jgi:hypothetical protein